MFRIISNIQIAPSIFRMEVEAPLVARKACAGQFVIVRTDERGERIPLTIADKNSINITLIYQVVGVTTTKLSAKKTGEFLMDVAGPLGHATEVRKMEGVVVGIAGGVGIAELYPVLKAYRSAGNKVMAVIGAKNRELLIMKKEIAGVCDRLIVTTDDGSEGEKGFVSDVLKRLIDESEMVSLVYAVGPAMMMKVISDLTRPYKIATVVSLNTVLVDGTGMCGSCRVDVGGKTMFVCVDGPEFDGHQVNFEELMSRQRLFVEQEKHACRIRGIVK